MEYLQIWLNTNMENRQNWLNTYTYGIYLHIWLNIHMENRQIWLIKRVDYSHL
jgi:hypothetical protein